MFNQWDVRPSKNRPDALKSVRDKTAPIWTFLVSLLLKIPSPTKIFLVQMRAGVSCKNSLLKKNGEFVHVIMHNKDFFAACAGESPCDKQTVKGVQSVRQQPCAGPHCSCFAQNTENYSPFGCKGECILHTRPRPEEAWRGRESHAGPARRRMPEKRYGSGRSWP